MSYSAQNIRNICLLGHGGNGKTSLAESMLYLTGGTERLGKTPDGNTTCDYDQEEVKRQISISMACAPLPYRDHKLNVLDTPGNFDFAGEVCSALYAADTGVMVCSAKDGLSVGAGAAEELLGRRLTDQQSGHNAQNGNTQPLHNLVHPFLRRNQALHKGPPSSFSGRPSRLCYLIVITAGLSITISNMEGVRRTAPADAFSPYSSTEIRFTSR